MLKKFGIVLAVVMLGIVIVNIIAPKNKDTSPISEQQAEWAISQSDDFVQYRTVFIASTQQLIVDGRCSIAKFEESGGWKRSKNFKSEAVYFIDCGGLRASKVYLNAKTGQIY